MPFYAVAKGRNVGIYTTWNECKKQVLNYFGAKYRKFDTEEEAIAFIKEFAIVPANSSTSTKKTSTKVHPLLIPHEKTDLFIYTDGACSKNGSKNAKAGIGIYFGENDTRNKSIRLTGVKQTNNVAELTALNKALHLVISDTTLTKKHITFVSDSKYSIQCLTTYGDKCAKQEWTADIPNKELVKDTYTLYNQHVHTVRLMHIMAHTGDTDIHSIGNHNADMLAVRAISI